jgi:hypothetical protein
MSKYERLLQVLWLLALSVMIGTVFAAAMGLIATVERGTLRPSDFALTYRPVTGELGPISAAVQGRIEQGLTLIHPKHHPLPGQNWYSRSTIKTEREA